MLSFPNKLFSRHQVFPWKGLLISLCLLSGISFAFLSDRSNPYAYPFLEVTPKSNPLEPVERELTFYQQRLQQHPDGLTQTSLASAYFKMAQATGQNHWYLKADQTAQYALELLPFENDDAILIRARVAEAQHDFNQAIALAQQVLAANPTQDNALSLLVTSYLGKGQVTKADPIANQLVAQTPTLASYTLRSLVDIAKGDDQAARQHFQLALDSEETGELGSSEKIRVIWGKFLMDRGEYRQARALLHSALEISPQSPQVLVALADLDQREGHYQTASDRYEQVFQSQTAAHVLDHAAAAGRAELYQLQGETELAEQWWNQAEQSLRDHGELKTFGHQRELARLLLTRGEASDISEALSLMSTEVKNRQDPETLETYAWALSMGNRDPDALEALQTAMNSGVKSPMIYFRAAAIARKLKQIPLADRYQATATQLDPNLPSALLSLRGVI